MNVDRPHNIIPGREIPKDDQRARARYLKLTSEEMLLLSPMTADERHEWLKQRLPTKERLARHLEAEGLPDLAYRARQGLYDDFDDGGHATPQLKLLADLKSKGRYDLKWIVTSGEYDATKQESDAWAARQTGETRAILEQLSAMKDAP